MKYVVSLIVVSILVTSSLTAQRQFGLKVGANFGDIVETIDINAENTAGFDPLEYELKVTPQLGIWLELPLTSQLSLQPELLWTQRIQQQSDANPMETHVDFHYFSLPVMAKYKLGKLSIEAGPEVSLLLDQSFENASSGLEENPLIEENSLEFAVNLGLQYQHKRWIIGARASRSVTSFLEFDFTDVNGEVVGTLKDFHQSGVVWIGYQIL